MMRPGHDRRGGSRRSGDAAVPCTVLAMHITDEALWRNPDTVKIIHNDSGEVPYTSRAAVPYCKGAFSPALMARRIYGIFAFRWRYLKAFTAHAETRLRATGGLRQQSHPGHAVPAGHSPLPLRGVCSPWTVRGDIGLVEKHMSRGSYWGLYK